MAYAYDGTADYTTLVDCSNVPNWEGATYASMSCWFYLVGTPGTFDTWVGARRTGDNDHRWGFQAGTTSEETEPTFFCSNGASESFITSNQTVSTDAWHHIYGTFDGSLTDQNRLKVWIDGVLATETNSGSSGAGSAEPSTVSSDMGNLHLGVFEATTTQLCACRVAELAIWAGADAQETVTSSQRAVALADGAAPTFFPVGLSAYWPLVNDFNDVVSGLTVVSNSGGTATAHPRVIRPHKGSY